MTAGGVAGDLRSVRGPDTLADPGHWHHGPVRVAVLGTHRAFVEAVALGLNAESDVEAAYASVSGDGGPVPTVIESDVVVVETTPDRGNGLEAVRQLSSARADLPLVVLIPEGDVDTACAAVRAGALGIVTKNTRWQELVDAVRAVSRDESWVPRHLLSAVLRDLRKGHADPTPDEALVDRLTAREREVLALMVAGLSRAGIARQLCLSINTVRTHTRNILAKLEVHSGLEAVGVALRAGLRADDSVVSPFRSETRNGISSERR